ncbi:hypothetical protein BX666DRAFT_1904410 [Dichotomocladium elegans]|nr:hypothetical protein BX666DRAFT_1904410 [Dichotomocladium elegans]
MQRQHSMMSANLGEQHQFEEFESIYQKNKSSSRVQDHHQWHDEFQNFQNAHRQDMWTQHEEEAFEHAFQQAKQGADMKWEQEFTAQETSWINEFVERENITNTTTDAEKESLAMTAGLLLQSVDADNNPKFKGSQFMNLMRNLRDRKISIEGNKMVPLPSSQGGDWASEFGHSAGQQRSVSWADDFAKHTDAFGTTGTRSSGVDTNVLGSGARELHVSSSPAFEGHMRVKQDHISKNTIDSSTDWATEFGKQEQRMEKLPGNGSEMSDWVEQYQRGIERIKKAQDTNWEDMQKDWDSIQDASSSRATNPDYETYNFAINNPYLLDHSAIDRVEHTTLADSILALEAKAQLQASDAMAWQELGFKQQENERDAAAIAALRRAVSIDPSLIDGWLALAVSYTNENCRMDVYEALEQWILNNEKYKHLAAAAEASTTKHNRHEYLTNMFINAARSSPGAEMDADVQVALGVLFNVSEEYAKAIDCFRAALQSRPQDYLLWNKLGATQANSRDSAAAIDAYFTAIELNPSYVRARYNLAISCINLGQTREAAEHLLTALAIQQQADSQFSTMLDEHGYRIPVQDGMSENIWDSLRMLMFMMNREDLAKECDKRNFGIFRDEFDF